LRVPGRAVQQGDGGDGGGRRLPVRLHDVLSPGLELPAPDHPAPDAVAERVPRRPRTVLAGDPELPGARRLQSGERMRTESRGLATTTEGGPSPPTSGTFGPALRLMSGRSVGFAVTFFIPVVLVRLLDQTDFGTYKQIFLIAGTLYVLGQLGMAESLFYFLPLSPRQGARFVANSLLALVLGGFGSLAVLELGGGAVSRWLSNGALSRYAPAVLRRQLAYAVPFQLSAIVEILQGNLHNYAVSHYFDAATFAIYSVGCLQIPLVDFVLNSVSNVMMVRMAEEIRDGRMRAAAAVWRDTT